MPGRTSKLDLAHQVTEEQLLQRQRSAGNPFPRTSPDSSYIFLRNSFLKRREKVYLNVYNLVSCNNCLSVCGLPITHSSIEVYGIEFAFGGHPGSSTGVFETKPFHVLVGENILPDSGQFFFQEHALLCMVLAFQLMCTLSGDNHHRIFGPMACVKTRMQRFAPCILASSRRLSSQVMPHRNECACMPLKDFTK